MYWGGLSKVPRRWRWILFGNMSNSLYLRDPKTLKMLLITIPDYKLPDTTCGPPKYRQLAMSGSQPKHQAPFIPFPHPPGTVTLFTAFLPHTTFPYPKITYCQASAVRGTVLHVALRLSTNWCWHSTGSSSNPGTVYMPYSTFATSGPGLGLDPKPSLSPVSRLLLRLPWPLNLHWLYHSFCPSMHLPHTFLLPNS